ncbi:hypothetical protein AVEN_19117-1, partial [Araneus ventricosus]
TNNSSELLSSIVSKFNRLFDTIRNLNPKIKLLISGLVPRGPNRFSYGFVSAAYGTFPSSLNIKIEAINAELEQLADLQGFYFFRRNLTNWKGCLGRDGLHLNFKGNRELADDFVKQLEGRISTEHVYRRKSKSIIKKIVQNALYDEVPANTFCLSASNEQFVYSDEFPALPSNNAFLSLPAIDSVCFTSPAYSFVSTLAKPVSSLSQPLLSKTVSSASLQFPLPQCSQPIISQNLLSKLVPSLPVPATESGLSSAFPKPLPQCSCFITSSQAPLSNLIPSLSPHAAESELSSTTFKPLPQRSRPITTQAPLSELIPSSSPLTTESKLPSKPLFSCLMPFLSVPAAKSKVYSAFSKPLPRHSHRQGQSLSVYSNQMFNIKVSNSFGILENMSELENPVDNLLKGVCTEKNGGGAISKICKVCQDSFPSYYLYKKHVQSSNCSLALSDSRKITYPRKCDKCFSTYATKSSFSNHKRSCSKKLELSNVINDSSSIADSSSSSKLALSYPIYACNVCSKTFSTKCSLNRHEEICSNPTEPLFWHHVCV